MKIKTYYINEGRHFDINDVNRQKIVSAGLKFYTQYNGYVENGRIYIIRGEDDIVSFWYDSDIFVH